MTYSELLEKKQKYQAYSPYNAPVGVYVGKVPDGEENAGKLIMLNSALTPVRGMPVYDSETDMLPVFNRMNELMAHVDAPIWRAATVARDEVQWETEAKAAGMSVEQYRAQKEAERQAEELRKAEAKKLKERVKELTDKGIKVRSGKRGTEIALTGDMIEQFKAFMAAQNGNNMPLAEFLTQAEIGDTPAEPAKVEPAKETPLKNTEKNAPPKKGGITHAKDAISTGDAL